MQFFGDLGALLVDLLLVALSLFGIGGDKLHGVVDLGEDGGAEVEPRRQLGSQAQHFL